MGPCLFLLEHLFFLFYCKTRWTMLVDRIGLKYCFWGPQYLWALWHFLLGVNWTPPGTISTSNHKLRMAVGRVHGPWCKPPLRLTYHCLYSLTLRLNYKYFTNISINLTTLYSRAQGNQYLKILHTLYLLRHINIPLVCIPSLVFNEGIRPYLSVNSQHLVFYKYFHALGLCYHLRALIDRAVCNCFTNPYWLVDDNFLTEIY